MTMPAIELIPRDEILRVERAVGDSVRRLAIVADMHRANTLATVKRAGSGHLGTSFSSLDIVTWLYHARMNTREVGIDHPDRDVYFSSKGHDAPGLYAVLYALGWIDEARFLRLRRLGGTAGHPDVATPGVEANTGSLGMGVSKGVGIALAKRHAGAGGRVYVMTGDGELQEGQIYEALMTGANHRLGGLTVIVDHNKVQSDRLVSEIGDLGDVEAKARAFGWHTERCDGHDMRALDAALERCEAAGDRPQLIVADTIKGRGVSFMEHPRALAEGDGCYRWHAGAPDDESFVRAYAELTARIDAALAGLGQPGIARLVVPPEPARASGVSREYVARAYGEALVALAPRVPDLIVLDADLAVDCHVRAFERAYPDRFVEVGISEQDMVSIAGAMARQGLRPVVNSFAAFLAARANEQIYNNACEGARVIYAAHYAGLLPAGPGSTHQSVRDIALFGSVSGLEILQPSSAGEARMALEYLLCDAPGAGVLRMNIGPSPREIALPDAYRLSPGRGCVIAGDGRAGVRLIAYGPVMLHEALIARDALAARGEACDVINHPWLNRFDEAWLEALVSGADEIVVIEDHSPVGALGDALRRRLSGRDEASRVRVFGVEGLCACGTPDEALRHHGLDGASIAARVIAGRTGR